MSYHAPTYLIILSYLLCKGESFIDIYRCYGQRSRQRDRRGAPGGGRVRKGRHRPLPSSSSSSSYCYYCRHRCCCLQLRGKGRRRRGKGERSRRGERQSSPMLGRLFRLKQRRGRGGSQGRITSSDSGSRSSSGISSFASWRAHRETTTTSISTSTN